MKRQHVVRRFLWTKESTSTMCGRTEEGRSVTYDDNVGYSDDCRWGLLNSQRQEIRYLTGVCGCRPPFLFWRYVMPETCETCRYFIESWDGEHCKNCSSEHSCYEVKSQDIPSSK